MSTPETGRRRGGIGIGIVAALVAGGLVAVALPGEQAPRPPAAAVDEQTAGGAGIEGRAVVLGPGGEVSIVDLATGRSERLFTDDRLSYAVRAGESVIVGGGAVGGSNGRGYVVRPDGSYAGLPGATGAHPDPAGTGFWAFSLARGIAAPEVRHYDLTGRPLGPVVRLPRHADVSGVYDGGLVLNQGESYNVHLYDPATGRVTAARHLSRMIDVVARRVAWVPDLCERDCPVSWADLPDGLAQPAGRIEVRGAVVHGVLSADGAWLALWLRDGPDPLLVCELAERACARPRDAAGVRGITWAADDRTLLVTLPGSERLAAWRPGWEELRPIPGRHRVTGLAALGS